MAGCFFLIDFMKTFSLLLIPAAWSLVLLASCSNPVKNKLKGTWRSKDGTVKLHITEKGFMMDDDESLAEDYFLKGDTIFTSFQGNKPYTGFIIQKLDDNYLKLMGPDSIAVEYNR
jgi:hypothetical protein